MRKLFTQPWHYYILCGVFFVALVIWLPDSGYDKYFWVSWAKYIHVHGITHAYDNPEINYHPVILYIIKYYSIFFENSEQINYTNINWLKLPTALFDWGIIFIALRLLKEHGKSLQWALLLVFNPAFWYNTIIWGQFDSIWVFFTLLSFYLMYRKRPYWAFVVFLLALNTKLFALFFLPFLILYCIQLKLKMSFSYYDHRLKFIRTIGPIWGVIQRWILVQAILILPLAASPQFNIPEIIQRSTDYYHSLSRNAYNVWYYFFNDPVTTEDTGYIQWVFLFVGVIFALLLLMQYQKEITVWQAVAMASIIFFFLLTRMHERYAHAAMVFAAILFFTSRNTPSPLRGTPPILGGELAPSPFRGRVGVGVLISLAYFLNLEAVMQTANKSLGLNINYQSILFAPKMVATLYFIACLLLAYDIIRNLRFSYASTTLSMTKKQG